MHANIHGNNVCGPPSALLAKCTLEATDAFQQIAFKTKSGSFCTLSHRGATMFVKKSIGELRCLENFVITLFIAMFYKKRDWEKQKYLLGRNVPCNWWDSRYRCSACCPSARTMKLKCPVFFFNSKLSQFFSSFSIITKTSDAFEIETEESNLSFMTAKPQFLKETKIIRE